jgi:ABC-2 type transport system ATP-binding protein
MIKIAHLSKSYQQNLVLDDISLAVMPGQIYALVGHNGAGKSTTIKHILGLEKPSQGQVLVGEYEPYLQPEAARASMAYIPEALELFPPLTVLENLCFFAKIGQIDLPETSAHALLQKVGLRPEQHQQKLNTCSKGMKQKLAIAIALSKQASVLILDEPNSGLDPKASQELAMLLQALAQEGCTIFLVTHDLLAAHQIAHQIGILKRGKLLEEFNPKSTSFQALHDFYFEALNLP